MLAAEPADGGEAGPVSRHRETGWIIHQAANLNPNPAYKWLEVALEATARDVERIGVRPPIISREVSIYVTAMYDAWAAYVATGRRPPAGTSQLAPDETWRC